MDRPAALALIFLFNAFGVVDQTRAAHELAAHGAPAALVPTLIVAGHALQLVAGIALVIGGTNGSPRWSPDRYKRC